MPTYPACEVNIGGITMVRTQVYLTETEITALDGN